MVAFILTLIIAAFLPNIQCQNVPRRGTIRLVRNGLTSSSYTSGRVQIYLSSWGHICDDIDFGITEATVVCHQMGYSSASTYTRSSLDSFGLVSGFTYALDNVDCLFSSYLVILQCSHSTFISSGCSQNGDEVSVTCLSTRIWSSPYDGQIRLQRAQYTNQGLVEVYCNGQWGTICDDFFGLNDANTVCRQQGYTGAEAYDSLSLTGSSSQPIWFTSVPCSFTYSCLRNCQLCRTTPVTSCSHSEDITVECEFLSGRISSTRLSTCDFGTSTSGTSTFGTSTSGTSRPTITLPTVNITGIIIGVVIVSLVCTFLPIIIPVVICCCLGIGICGASRSRGPSRRVVTSAAPPPSTTAVVTTTQTQSQKVDYPTGAYPTQQPTSYPAQPPPPAYAAQPPAAYPAQPPAAYPAQPPAAYQDAYPAPDGGYPLQSYPPPTAEQPEPLPYGGPAYPPVTPYP